MKKLCIVCLLGLLCWSSLSQEPERDEEELPRDEFENALQSMERDQKTILKAVEEMAKGLSPEEQKEFQEAIQTGDQKKIQELTQKIIKNGMKGGDGGIDKLVEMSLSSFRKKEASELKSEILGRAQGTIAAPLFENFPKTLDLTVKVLQHPSALPQLFKISNDRTKLIIFLVINILLFIFAKIIKRRQLQERKDLGSAFGRWFFFVGARFTVLMIFFGRELWPIMSLTFKTLTA